MNKDQGKEAIMERNIFQETLFDPRGHFPVTSSLVAGKPHDARAGKGGKAIMGAVAVNGLLCLLVLAAFVACQGNTGDSSTHAQTQPPTQTPIQTPPPTSASSFLVDCQGKTGVPSTQPPTFTTSFHSDALVHVPPTTGPYAYNIFMPGAIGFPAVGETYTDPIFGGVIRRLTDTVGHPNQEDIYAHHWANAKEPWPSRGKI
jgi:hypothetical protein